MNKQSKLYYKLMTNFLLNNKKMIHDFSNYYSNFVTMKNNKLIYHERFYMPLKTLLKDNIRMHNYDSSDDSNAEMINEYAYDPLALVRDKNLLQIIKDTSESTNIFYKKNFDCIDKNTGESVPDYKYVPLEIEDLEKIKLGLECYLSDPLHSNRAYGRVWMFFHYFNKMPKISKLGLKHSINYYRRRFQTPLQVKKYFPIIWKSKVYKENGKINGRYTVPQNKVACYVDSIFVKSKLGKILNKANH